MIFWIYSTHNVVAKGKTYMQHSASVGCPNNLAVETNTACNVYSFGIVHKYLPFPLP